MKNLLHMKPGESGSLKYLVDLERETGELFGYPLPNLPQGDEIEGGQKKIFVDFSPMLGSLFRDFLQAVYPVAIGEQEEGSKTDESMDRLKEILVKTQMQAVIQERRNGLYNLFYLSISKLFSGIVHDFISTGGRKPHHKYLLHFKVSALLSGVHKEALKRVEELSHGSVAFRLGPSFNASLIRSILEDQLPLVTTELEEISIQDILGASKVRFSITSTSFKEIYGILFSRIRDGIEHHDMPWLKKIQNISGYPEPVNQRSISNLLKSTDLVRYLLMDYDEVGRKILSSKNIKKEDLPYAELNNAYLDFMQALKRNEMIQLLKRNVEILSERQAARAEDLYNVGSLYRYHEDGRIVNESRSVTTVFMDLRGFTKKSEEAISAGELTDELYAIFDPLTLIVNELHGKIDKFTGDGMMVTFGVETRSKEDPLNALRMAVRIQETLRSLRKSGKTQFQMGISIHTGVAFVANFIAGEDRVDNTVIGRNVNIAGRLSSAGDIGLLQKQKKEFDDLVESLGKSLSSKEEKDSFLGTLGGRKSMDKTISGVSVDAQGNLYNLGIVLSQQTIQAIDQLVHLQSGEEGDTGYLYYTDPILSRQISLYYVGDAKFKGVDSAFPISAVLL